MSNPCMPEVAAPKSCWTEAFWTIPEAKPLEDDEKPVVVVVVVVDEPSVEPELVVVSVVPEPSVEMAVHPVSSKAVTPASSTFVEYEVIAPHLFIYMIPTKIPRNHTP